MIDRLAQAGASYTPDSRQEVIRYLLEVAELQISIRRAIHGFDFEDKAAILSEYGWNTDKLTSPPTEEELAGSTHYLWGRQQQANDMLRSHHANIKTCLIKAAVEEIVTPEEVAELMDLVTKVKERTDIPWTEDFEDGFIKFNLQLPNGTTEPVVLAILSKNVRKIRLYHIRGEEYPRIGGTLASLQIDDLDNPYKNVISDLTRIVDDRGLRLRQTIDYIDSPDPGTFAEKFTPKEWKRAYVEKYLGLEISNEDIATDPEVYFELRKIDHRLLLTLEVSSLTDEEKVETLLDPAKRGTFIARFEYDLLMKALKLAADGEGISYHLTASSD